MVVVCSGGGGSGGLAVLFARVAVRGGGEVAARLTFGRRTRVRVRDMMIDRVAPCRGAAAQSDWAVRGHRRVVAVVGAV